MLLGYTLQVFTNVTASVALTNTGALCDRSPSPACTFFWPTGTQTTASTVTISVTGLVPFVPKAGMLLGLSGLPAGTKITVSGIKATDGSTVALGGNSLTQRAAVALDKSIRIYWQFDDGLPLISGWTYTIYNDINGATGIATGAQCGIGEAGICPAVWIDHEPAIQAGPIRMARMKRKLSGAVNYVNRPVFRSLSLHPSLGTDADWRQATLANGMDFESLVMTVAADPYVLVFDTTDPTVVQRAGLFGICTKVPMIDGLDGPYVQIQTFDFEEIVSGSAGGLSSAPSISSDSTKFLRSDGAWTNILTGPITVTGITLQGLTGYVKANGAGAATAQASVPTSDLTGTLAQAQMPALGGDLAMAAATLSPTVAKIRGVNVAAAVPASGQVLAFDGTNWTPTNVGAGGGGLGLGSMAYQNANAVNITGGVITTTGNAVINGVGQFTGSSFPTTGAGVEVSYYMGIGGIAAYDRGASAYKPLLLGGSSVALQVNAVTIFDVGLTTAGVCTFSKPLNVIGQTSILYGTDVSNPVNNSQVVLYPNAGALGRGSFIRMGATFSSGWGGADYGVRYSGGVAYTPRNSGANPRDMFLGLYSTDSSDNPALAFSASYLSGNYSLSGLKVTGNLPSPTFTGNGLEMFFDGTNTTLQSFNRSSTTFSPLVIAGSTITFGGIAVNLVLDASGNLNFGTVTRQMLNLWSTSFAIGVQNSTVYVRTGGGFNVYYGGTHSNTQNDPGTGGTKILGLDNGGNLTILGNFSAANFAPIPTSEYNAGNTTAATTLNFAANGIRQACTLGANTSFSLTAPATLATIVLRITNGATAYTATWPASVKWPGNVAPNLGSANAETIVTLYWNGTKYYGSAMGPF